MTTDDEIPWPPQEKTIRPDEVSDDLCFIIRYNANDPKLERSIKRIPHYFGCKYRYILWMHFVRKDLEKLKCRKQALKDFISKLDSVRNALLSHKPTTLPRIPSRLPSFLRQKHRELTDCIGHSSSREERRSRRRKNFSEEELTDRQNSVKRRTKRK